MAEFRTSFIPKKPTSVKIEKKPKGRGIGFLSFVAFVVFLLSLVISGGLYFYKAVLDSRIKTMSESINRVREAIEPDLVANLIEIDSRINTSGTLLDDHTIVSPIFRVLEDKTLRTVRFDKISYFISDEEGVNLLLSGEALDYASLALQSDIFGDEAAFEEPIFENLRLNEQGNVAFDFRTPIDKSFILYKNNLNVPPRITEESFEIESADETISDGSSLEDDFNFDLDLGNLLNDLEI